MPKFPSTPVHVGNRKFPSIKAAAAAFNVTPRTISRHLDKGTLEELLGRTPSSPRIRPKARSVSAFGKTFSSVRDLCRHFKIPINGNIYSHSTTEAIEAYIKRHRENPPIARGPYEVHGRVFPTLASIADHYGYSHTQVSRLYAAGKLQTIKVKQ